MTRFKTIQSRALMVLSSGLFIVLAGCASTYAQNEPVDEKAGMAMADKSTMKAECQAMHENMMAKKAEGGMTGHAMMPPEMTAKHEKCMANMPEMKAKMQAKCAAHKAGTMNHDMDGKEMMSAEKMTEHCAMMEAHAASEGAEE